MLRDGDVLTRAMLAAGLAAMLASAPARAESCGDLLVVYDRSGSMANCSIKGETKERIAKRAMRDVLAQFGQTPTGLMVFPDTLKGCPPGPGDAACAPGTVVVDVSADGASKTAGYLESMPGSCGGTPTGETLELASAYTKWTPGRRHYVLLITDGQPTCKDGLDGGKPDPRDVFTCTPSEGPSTPCDGKGNCECKNPVRAFDAIKAMYERGIHTFVVGFEGAGSGAGCTGASGTGAPFTPMTLDRMAELGGEPSAGATRYYPATDAASLAAALDKILGMVVGATVAGCARDGGAGTADGAHDAAADPSQGSQDGRAEGTDDGAGGGSGGGTRGGAPGCACRVGSGPPSAPAGALALLWLGRRRVRS